MAPASPASKSNSDKNRLAGGAAAPLGERLSTYLKGVRSEWDKITWPTWPQIWGQTIVVLVMVSIITLGLFLIDNAFSLILQFITPTRS